LVGGSRVGKGRSRSSLTPAAGLCLR
jgi:hypothetical protein